MNLEHLPTLLTPEKPRYLSGVERLTDGVLHVAVLTRMPFGRALAVHCHEEMSICIGTANADVVRERLCVT
jgi:hypothetical protein